MLGGTKRAPLTPPFVSVLVAVDRERLRGHADRWLSAAAELERGGDVAAARAARDRADHLLASASVLSVA